MRDLNVPKIAAPTIAANRDLRSSAIFQAATQVARESGLNKITVSEIARRTGMGRSSIYAYYDSTADLAADVLIEELTIMQQTLLREVRLANTLDGGLAAWVTSSLAYVHDGRHELMKSIASVELPAVRRAEITRLHAQLAAPLIELLAMHNVKNANSVVHYISGVVSASVSRLTTSGDLETEIATVLDFIRNGISTS